MSLCSQASTIEEAKKYIDSIDFSMIIEKMTHSDVWLLKDAQQTCALYRNFLFLKKKYENTSIKVPPSKDIDEFWHYHILDTKKYRYDCEAIFGYYLHHHPTYPGKEGKQKLKILAKNFEKLQDIHFSEFGEYIVETREKRYSFVNILLHKIQRYRQSK